MLHHHKDLLACVRQTSQIVSQKQHMKWVIALVTGTDFSSLLTQLAEKNSDTWHQEIMEKETYSGFQTLNKELYITILGNHLLPSILMGYEILVLEFMSSHKSLKTQVPGVYLKFLILLPPYPLQSLLFQLLKKINIMLQLYNELNIRCLFCHWLSADK